MSTTITTDGVVGRSGDLQVNCTVKYMESRSNWNKVFSFHNGKVIRITARRIWSDKTFAGIIKKYFDFKSLKAKQ